MDRHTTCPIGQSKRLLAYHNIKIEIKTQEQAREAIKYLEKTIKAVQDEKFSRFKKSNNHGNTHKKS